MRRLAPLALLGALACGPATGPDAVADPGGAEGAVVARHAHYRVTLHTASPPASDRPGELRLRVDTANGWHIAEEAPARLDLEASDALAFEPAALRREDALAHDEDGFEFATAVRAVSEGRIVAKGRLKFGICEGPKAHCVVVRRDLELPIDVAFEP